MSNLVPSACAVQDRMKVSEKAGGSIFRRGSHKLMIYAVKICRRGERKRKYERKQFFPEDRFPEYFSRSHLLGRCFAKTELTTRSLQNNVQETMKNSYAKVVVVRTRRRLKLVLSYVKVNVLARGILYQKRLWSVSYVFISCL